MGKVRQHISSDDAAIAEWIARKLVNHDPMQIREAAGVKQGLKISCPAITATGKFKRVDHAEGSTSVVYTLKDGRQFRIEVCQTAGFTVSDQAMAD